MIYVFSLLPGSIPPQWIVRVASAAFRSRLFCIAVSVATRRYGIVFALPKCVGNYIFVPSLLLFLAKLLSSEVRGELAVSYSFLLFCFG